MDAFFILGGREMEIQEELILIRKELQDIKEILESVMVPRYRVERKDGKLIRTPISREAALKELRR